jgi:uncharacterized membrane protein
MAKTIRPWAVTGDHPQVHRGAWDTPTRMVYSRHASRDLALRAARRLARRWGWVHPGAEPAVQHDTTGATSLPVTDDMIVIQAED